jgi:hypothetical protein
MKWYDVTIAIVLATLAGLAFGSVFRACMSC